MSESPLYFGVLLGCEASTRDKTWLIVVNRFKKPNGSWLLAEELLDNGDPGFVDELCRIADADRLGSFAKTLYADRRPASRKLMLAYLDRPFQHYRHEALVKRLLKLAEQNGDDEVMAKYLVGVDRSIRRKKVTRHRYDWSSRESWTEESIRTPSFTEMPRNDHMMQYHFAMLSEEHRKRVNLFSVTTRKYLRRRLWRYFRTIAKTTPAKYVSAVLPALASYTDDDCVDGLAMLDNWGLMHVLFGQSDVLIAKASGWTLAEGKSLGELKPAPAFSDLWKARAESLIELLSMAKCRPVRQWTIQMLETHHQGAIGALPVDVLVGWLSSDDSELAQLAVEALRKSDQTSQISITRWLQLLESSNPQVLDVICEIMVEKTSPDTLSLQDVVALACGRPVPVAKLGLKWLEARSVSSAEDCQTFLLLAEAQAEPVRGDLVRLAKEKITASSYYASTDVLEFLDSPFIDVREAGWEWLLSDDKAGSDATNWQRLLETPYDDIQLKLTAFLEKQTGAKPGSRELEQQVTAPKNLDAKLVRLLWASVLLNIHRGGKQKPAIVAAMVQRLEKCPDEASELLPILSVALRSVRSVEWRSGLAGIVRLIQRQPELQPTIEKEFPELSLDMEPV